MRIQQLLDIINVGIVIFDRSYKVREWNHWMAIHSGISRKDIMRKNLFVFFPGLNNQSFLRSIKSVLVFGHTFFFSQKLYNYLFPCELTGPHASVFKYMQQTCAMGPVKNRNGENERLLITVQDATENVVMEKHLRELNLMDPLTKVYNRRYFDQRLQEEILRYRRYHRPLCVIMFDLDRFKNVNDTYGHTCGDKVLMAIASLALQLIRGTDIVARYGGEEFCCILPDTDLKGAFQVAERIRKTVEETPTVYDDFHVVVTLSIGVATMHEEILASNGAEKLVYKADQAMYLAKRNGRNRVEVSIN